MKLFLVKWLTSIGLAIFSWGDDLAERWGLHDKIWTEFNDAKDLFPIIVDEDDPENPLDDLDGLDPDVDLPKEKCYARYHFEDLFCRFK